MPKLKSPSIISPQHEASSLENPLQNQAKSLKDRREAAAAIAAQPSINEMIRTTTSMHIPLSKNIWDERDSPCVYYFKIDPHAKDKEDDQEAYTPQEGTR